MRTTSDSSDDGNNNGGRGTEMSERDGESGGFFLSGNSESGRQPVGVVGLDFLNQLHSGPEIHISNRIIDAPNH